MLPALAIAIPFGAAVLLGMLGRKMPRFIADGTALAAAAATVVVCALLLARGEMTVYWFGGWTPRAGGIALGIAFAVDGVGAGLALTSAILTLVALVFSLRYFDSIGAMFHVLMLVFLGALVGFSLTGDLFNLFVFFELMGAAAYALCGYKSEEPAPIQGAINFGVTNTVGAFFVLVGIALLYGRTGALNLAQVGESIGAHRDALVIVAFTCITCGFLVKAAAVPFHLWLADAHAVAPTPVCVLFSGVMVEAGLYAVMRVHSAVFAPALSHVLPGERDILVGLGVFTVSVGAVMCFAQRHLKRLLAFSTISHAGVMLIGFGLLDAGALAGSMLYFLGHAAIKSALFLCAGIVLHTLRDVDEVKLRGCGRRLKLTAIVYVIAGLALAGAPPFVGFLGAGAIGESARAFGFGWVRWIIALGGVLTGAAVLRAGGRIFLGLGPPSEEIDSAEGETGEAPETRPGDAHAPATMIAGPIVLVAGAIVLGLVPPVQRAVLAAASHFHDHTGYVARVLYDIPTAWSAAPLPVDQATALLHGGFAALAAVAVALVTLYRRRLPLARLSRVLGLATHPIRVAHSGRIGDYVAFLVVGVAGFGALAAWLFH